MSGIDDSGRAGGCEEAIATARAGLEAEVLVVHDDEGMVAGPEVAIGGEERDEVALPLVVAAGCDRSDGEAAEEALGVLMTTISVAIAKPFQISCYNNPNHWVQR